MFHKRESKYIIYFFLIFFGFTFVLGNEKLDSFHYAEYFRDISNLSLLDFKKMLSNFLLSENSLDLAQPILSFLISRFSDNYHLLFGCIASIFGYFYLKSINILYIHYHNSKSQISLLFLLFFVLILNPIFNINGYRFWIATWVFFYGGYVLITTKDKKYLFVCFLSMFFHFSFIFPNFILLVYLFLGNQNFYYYILFIVSFFISDIILQLFPSLISGFGVGIESKAGRYANSDQIEMIGNNANLALEQGKWYLYLPAKLTFYYILISFFFLKFKYRNLPFPKSINDIFSFIKYI